MTGVGLRLGASSLSFSSPCTSGGGSVIQAFPAAAAAIAAAAKAAAAAAQTAGDSRGGVQNGVRDGAGREGVDHRQQLHRNLYRKYPEDQERQGRRQGQGQGEVPPPEGQQQPQRQKGQKGQRLGSVALASVGPWPPFYGMSVDDFGLGFSLEKEQGNDGGGDGGRGLFGWDGEERDSQSAPAKIFYGSGKSNSGGGGGGDDGTVNTALAATPASNHSTNPGPAATTTVVSRCAREWEVGGSEPGSGVEELAGRTDDGMQGGDVVCWW